MSSIAVHKPARLLLAALIAATGATVLAVPAAASANPVVTLQIGPPPPPRFEIAPQARRGYVWSPGHWEWRRGSYVWIAGNWLAARPGYAYSPPRWHQDGGRWRYSDGRWAASPPASQPRQPARQPAYRPGRLPDRYQPPPVVDNSPGHRTDRGRDYRAGNNWPAATPGRPQ